MDIFFSRRYRYSIVDSLENFRAEFDSITERKWHDFSPNITGRFIDANTFKLTHKWSLSYIRWIETRPAYLSGTISSKNNTTIIKCTLRPNSGFVIAFYIIAILFFCELIGIRTFVESSKYIKLLLFPFFNLILYGFMLFFTNGLRNRFERILNLRREQ